MTIFLLTLAAVLVAVGLLAFGVFAKFSFGGWTVELSSQLQRWQRAGVGLLSIAGGIALAAAAVAGSADDNGGTTGTPTPTRAASPGSTVTFPTPSQACGPAEVTLSTASAPRGGQVTVFGSCFEPGERVEIRVHVTVAGSATADTAGSFEQTITVPQSAPPPGFPTSISATGQSSIKTASAPFTTE